MNIQYISDSEGNETGVFIPINDWNKLKEKYSEIEELDYTVPDWHKEIILSRMERALKHPETMLDWDDVIDEIEKDLEDS